MWINRFFWLIAGLFSVLTALAQPVQVAGLRCEYRTNPVGVQTLTPSLSWQLKSEGRDVKQTTYRILVADSPEALRAGNGNCWDSGEQQSDASIQIPYGGKPLLATRHYYWKVKVRDNHRHGSAWSAVNSWQMGLLQPADWKQARWIAYEELADSLVNPLPTDGKKDIVTGGNVLPLFRKVVTVRKPIRQATMYMAGLGHFDLHLNGSKVGDHFMDAGWTKYDKEAQYVAFDLTHQLKTGENVLGVMLGNGFYYVPPVKGRYRKLKVMFGYPKMICRLAITYQDGTTADVVSDGTWKTAPSPVTFSSIYGGEDYDANLEQPGWDRPGFTDTRWRPVLLTDGPPSLIAQSQEPLTVAETFTPRSRQTLPSGDEVVDFGQNASGIVELSVRGHRGDTIRIYPAELLKADGSVNQKASGSPFIFTYVLKGNGIETWRPRFTYYGFRYAQVHSSPVAPTARPELLGIRSLHIRNAAARIGDFSCSNELFNRTNTLIDWAIKSNMVSVFTDCPHREKLGWLEELHLVGASVRYQYDIASLLKKAVHDMRTSQLPDGLIPEIAPEYVKFDWGGGIFRDSPEWGSSAVIVPWYLYQWFGEKNELADSYPMMQRYIAYLGTKAKNHILSQGLGDWYDLGPKPPGVSQLTPMGVTGTAIYYYDLTIMEQIAALLGKTDDARQYQSLAGEVRKAFNDTFFNKDTKQYATNSQTANAMALFMKLVEPQYEAAVVENLIADIRSRNNSLTAGDIGYRYLLRALEQAGRSDVIYAMNNRSDVPGYGYQLAQGATALTESWQALPTVSNNHFMLGHLMEWFYAGLVGIRQEETSVAFKHTVIYPQPVGDVTQAQAFYESPYGRIQCAWQRTGTTFDLTVVIPANTTATLYLPSDGTGPVLESGRPVKPVSHANGRAQVTVGSGTYRFRTKVAGL